MDWESFTLDEWDEMSLDDWEVFLLDLVSTGTYYRHRFEILRTLAEAAVALFSATAGMTVEISSGLDTESFDLVSSRSLVSQIYRRLVLFVKDNEIANGATIAVDIS